MADAARQPVWEALSELFLDTDPAFSREGRAQVLAASPYSLAELDAILAREVFPVCWPNLLATAGEWQGVDSDWLAEQIRLRQASPLRRWWGAVLGRIGLRCTAEWPATRQRVEQLRQ